MILWVGMTIQMSCYDCERCHGQCFGIESHITNTIHRQGDTIVSHIGVASLEKDHSLYSEVSSERHPTKVTRALAADPPIKARQMRLVLFHCQSLLLH